MFQVLSQVPGLCANSDSDLSFEEFRVWRRRQVCECGRFLPFAPTDLFSTLTHLFICPSIMACLGDCKGSLVLSFLGESVYFQSSPAADERERRVRLIIPSPCETPDVGRVPLLKVTASLKIPLSVDALLPDVAVFPSL